MIHTIRKRSVILTSVTFLLTAFIFIHSAMPAEISAQESGNVLGIFEMIFNNLGIDLYLTDHFVRKAAHFTEYFVLGSLVICTFLSYNKSIKKALLPALYYCLITPLFDETIQYFSVGRSAEVKDILLDYSGAVFGIFIMSLIIKLIRKKIPESQRNT